MYVYLYMNLCIHTCMHAYMYMYIYKHIYIHTRIQCVSCCSLSSLPTSADRSPQPEGIRLWARSAQRAVIADPIMGAVKALAVCICTSSTTTNSACEAMMKSIIVDQQRAIPHILCLGEGGVWQECHCFCSSLSSARALCSLLEPLLWSGSPMYIHDILISGPALSHLPVSEGQKRISPRKMTIKLDTYCGTRLQVSQPCSSSHALLHSRSDIRTRIFTQAISPCGWAHTPSRWQQLEHVGAGASQCQSP